VRKTYEGSGVVKNQFAAVLNDTTANCPTLQIISNGLSHQLGENNQTIACAMLTTYSDLVETAKQNARLYMPVIRHR
jgi:hypothetical protein